MITSVSWAAHIEDARDSLLRSRWDLIIVDEAHRMSATSHAHKTQYYQLGEALSSMTDHYLLMTATPHKGDPENFCLFLELLDQDVYGDVSSLQEAMRRNNTPFYLRRTKEALITFPDPETGKSQRIFTNRDVRTIPFEIDSDEYDFYEQLTHYVEEQSIKAANDESARGRALGFTMAMLQRRFASSIRAARRSLENMRKSREAILKNPEAYRRQQLERRLPDDFDDLPDDEQQKVLEDLESVVLSFNPADLRDEIMQLDRLIRQAEQLEQREIESKLNKLRQTLREYGVFDDTKMKLLIFTEHKDTLDYLVQKLREWELSVVQIDGSMKIGDAKEPKEGTRLHAEKAFRDSAQVLVATEAAGEGINLQFCWFMINYDIPWNPVRLEQRMGRIHRYGQTRDCLILNFVATNTREGRVLDKLMDRLREIRKDLGDHVFDVVGEVFPANLLEKLIREMYARRIDERQITARIVENVDVSRFRHITESTLEGLAKRELNLSAILGKAAEARERRLVPEVVEDFFKQSAALVGMIPKETGKGSGVYRIGKVSRLLWELGEQVEPRFGPLSREYRQIVFDKKRLELDTTSEWVTPGHPLFEAVRAFTALETQKDLEHGAIFFDLHRAEPAYLDVFTAAIRDGRNNIIHERLFVVQTDPDGTLTVRQPTIFLDLIPAPEGQSISDAGFAPDQSEIEAALYVQALEPFLNEIAVQRTKEIMTITEHLNTSLNTIIDRLNVQLGELYDQRDRGTMESGLEGRIKILEEDLENKVRRLEQRQAELRQEQHLTITDLRHHGRAWVLPHPDRTKPDIAPMVRDEEIERIAVEAVIAYEEARGWKVEDVQKDNKGFDLISRPADPDALPAIRYVEVKGRSSIGEVALTENEFKTATRLGDDYWLYTVYNCASQPQLHLIQDPARLNWQAVTRVEHYRIEAADILNSGTGF